jgi:hypothetical protein
MTDNADLQPAALSEEEIDQLRLIAGNAGSLMAVVRVHSALILASQIMKWLSAIVGAMMLFKGFIQW